MKKLFVVLIACFLASGIFVGCKQNVDYNNTKDTLLENRNTIKLPRTVDDIQLNMEDIFGLNKCFNLTYSLGVKSFSEYQLEEIRKYNRGYNMLFLNNKWQYQ